MPVRTYSNIIYDIFLFVVLSAMIRGASSPSSDVLFQVQDYTEDEVESMLEKYFGCLTKTES